MRRRSARKSRYGCKECKRRHVKCDETKPSCANCVIRRLQCSFVSGLPTPQSITSTPTANTTTVSPNPNLSKACQQDDEVQHGNSSMLLLSCRRVFDATEEARGLISPLSQDRTILTVPSPINNVLPEPTFQLHHLELFYHFEHDMWRFVSLDDVMGKNFMAMVTRQAITIPYLMDQLLAFSAAHMSTHRPYQACFYREEATHLQTRALGLFNAAKATGEAFPAFLFSILLSHQILFDTFSTRADFPTFLDKLVTSFHLCAGVRAIAGESWNSISMQYYQQTGMELPYKWILDTDSETIFTRKLTYLGRLIKDKSTDLSVSTPCIEALDILRNLSSVGDAPLSMPLRSVVVLRWAVAVPTDFVKLVEQRRPEALIITAYYGVLIHNARDFWVFGDAGAFIIRSITRYLGSCWDEWLAWPNEVLHATS
ncbi:hypothetical protein FHL15_008978 [Xylaria flabelliformis]|uniref:Zn(2)-C6 fungal-type domain-containing protein n=1 Tax=Xylaria flabelliformis TaxID=2512241 RepID=A0A553HQ53_9PEZI|nr:hypothetical protein FHL15_008978 [Xylaria flabelliformis]